MNQEFKDVFNRLYTDYHGMVKQLCTGFLKGDRELAADLVQEVYINIWNALSKFRGEASYKTWIYRITVNSCLHYLRKPKPAGGVPSELLENIGDQETARSQAEQEQIQLLYKAIGQLSEIDRLIIMMVLDELEYEEIASVTGVSEAALRVKIHRIKQRLKNIIQHAG